LQQLLRYYDSKWFVIPAVNVQLVKITMNGFHPTLSSKITLCGRILQQWIKASISQRYWDSYLTTEFGVHSHSTFQSKCVCFYLYLFFHFHLWRKWMTSGKLISTKFKSRRGHFGKLDGWIVGRRMEQGRLVLLSWSWWVVELFPNCPKVHS
jgi:hypothetical protein